MVIRNCSIPRGAWNDPHHASPPQVAASFRWDPGPPLGFGDRIKRCPSEDQPHHQTRPGRRCIDNETSSASSSAASRATYVTRRCSAARAAMLTVVTGAYHSLSRFACTRQRSDLWRRHFEVDCRAPGPLCLQSSITSRPLGWRHQVENEAKSNEILGPGLDGCDRIPSPLPRQMHQTRVM